MSLKRIFYLTKRQKLPRLRHHLTSGRELDEADDAVQALLEAGLVRDWKQAKRLIERSGKSAHSLFWELSKKRKPNWKRRLLNILIVSSGGYIHDPHRKELYELSGGKVERSKHNPNRHIEGSRYRRY
jgi:hypothetical protein